MTLCGRVIFSWRGRRLHKGVAGLQRTALGGERARQLDGGGRRLPAGPSQRPAHALPSRRPGDEAAAAAMLRELMAWAAALVAGRGGEAGEDRFDRADRAAPPGALLPAVLLRLRDAALRTGSQARALPERSARARPRARMGPSPCPYRARLGRASTALFQHGASPIPARTTRPRWSAGGVARGHPGRKACRGRAETLTLTLYVGGGAGDHAGVQRAGAAPRARPAAAARRAGAAGRRRPRALGRRGGRRAAPAPVPAAAGRDGRVCARRRARVPLLAGAPARAASRGPVAGPSDALRCACRRASAKHGSLERLALRGCTWFTAQLNAHGRPLRGPCPQWGLLQPSRAPALGAARPEPARGRAGVGGARARAPGARGGRRAHRGRCEQPAAGARARRAAAGHAGRAAAALRRCSVPCRAAPRRAAGAAPAAPARRRSPSPVQWGCWWLSRGVCCVRSE